MCILFFFSCVAWNMMNKVSHFHSPCGASSSHRLSGHVEGCHSFVLLFVLLSLSLSLARSLARSLSSELSALFQNTVIRWVWITFRRLQRRSHRESFPMCIHCVSDALWSQQQSKTNKWEIMAPEPLFFIQLFSCHPNAKKQCTDNVPLCNLSFPNMVRMR